MVRVQSYILKNRKCTLHLFYGTEYHANIFIYIFQWHLPKEQIWKKKKTILLLCFSHAVSVESELAKRANGNLETFQQCNIDIFKRSKFWSPPPAMSRMSILSQRVLQQRWIAVDQSMIFLTFSYQSILLSNKYIVTVDLYK